MQKINLIRITASQDILTFLPFITIALKSIFNNIIIENIKHIGCINDFERNQTCDNLCMLIHFRKYYTNICKEIIFKFHVRRGKDKGPPPQIKNSDFNLCPPPTLVFFAKKTSYFIDDSLKPPELGKCWPLKVLAADTVGMLMPSPTNIMMFLATFSFRVLSRAQKRKLLQNHLQIFH